MKENLNSIIDSIVNKPGTYYDDYNYKPLKAMVLRWLYETFPNVSLEDAESNFIQTIGVGLIYHLNNGLTFIFSTKSFATDYLSEKDLLKKSSSSIQYMQDSWIVMERSCSTGISDDFNKSSELVISYGRIDNINLLTGEVDGELYRVNKLDDIIRVTWYKDEILQRKEN